MSVEIVFLLALGTAEQMLILYAWFFERVYFILLFQLVEKLSTILHRHWLLPIVSLSASLVLLMIDAPTT